MPASDSNGGPTIAAMKRAVAINFRRVKRKLMPVLS
jgi:hypothetical protein